MDSFLSHKKLGGKTLYKTRFSIPRKLPYIQFNNTFYLNNSIYKTKTHPIKNKIATINKISFLILSGNNKKILPSNCNIKELSPIAGI